MKKLSLKNAKSMLSRKEMRAINGGGYTETCFSYSACETGCIQRRALMGGGWSYNCNSCCIA